jgi:hypothetical protein
MVLYQHVPPAPLSAFVRCFWYSEGAPDAHAKERLMPNGEPTIVFNLRDASGGSAERRMVVGLSDRRLA